MSSHNLVNAIVAGDAIEIENAFHSAITEKISARLDDYRQEIAQSMFTKESIEIDEALKTYNVQVGHPTGARTVKVQAKSKSHAVEVADKEHKKFGERVNKNSVELAKEEFAEILASEEFAKLDELSKTTLGSYVKKATGGLEGTARHAFDAGRHQALGNDAETDKSFAKSRQRISGVKKAVDRLTK